MDDIFRSINTLCDDNLIPCYEKFIVAIGSCPSSEETRLLQKEADKIKLLIEALKNDMNTIDMKIAKKYNM